MLKDITEVRHILDYKIHLRFKDGVEGELDLNSFVSFDGVFESLKDISEFKKVKAHPTWCHLLAQAV